MVVVAVEGMDGAKIGGPKLMVLSRRATCRRGNNYVRKQVIAELRVRGPSLEDE